MYQQKLIEKYAYNFLMKNLKEILIFLEFPLTQIIKISKNKNIFTLHLKNNSSFNLGYQCREIIINKKIIKKGW